MWLLLLLILELDKLLFIIYKLYVLLYLNLKFINYISKK